MVNISAEPTEELLRKVMCRIEREEKALVIRRIVLFSFTLIISIFGFLPAFQALSANLSNSGFIHFFSLMFSDFSTVSLYWRNFIMILLETLPAISITAFLIVLLVFLQSLRLLLRNIKIIRQSNRLIVS